MVLLRNGLEVVNVLEYLLTHRERFLENLVGMSRGTKINRAKIHFSDNGLANLRIPWLFVALEPSVLSMESAFRIVRGKLERFWTHSGCTNASFRETRVFSS